MSQFMTDEETFINPTGLAMTLSMGLLFIILPRKYALAPVVFLMAFMTMGQRVVVADLDFTMVRLLAVFGWIRVIVRGEIRRLQFTQIDRITLVWGLVSIVAYTILWKSSGAFINRLGMLYNTMGMYFLFRFIVRDLEDAKRLFRISAVFVLPVAAAMLYEHQTRHNVFAAFGGVQPVTALREGTLRCMGPFGHPILAGTFGASLLTYCIALWRRGGGDRVLAVLGTVGSVIVTFTSGSSGPVMTFMFTFVGFAAWKFKDHLRKVRWGLLLTIIGLNFVMKAPVWYLIARVNIFSGSTGYHRAYVIDAAFQRWREWFLVGTQSTIHWGDNTVDITNTFIWEGVNGGMVTMVLFIIIIAYCFKAVGLAVRASESDRDSQNLIWALGVALFTHVVTFFSVQYFDQNAIHYQLLIALIATVCGPYLAEQEKSKRQRASFAVPGTAAPAGGGSLAARYPATLSSAALRPNRKQNR